MNADDQATRQVALLALQESLRAIRQDWDEDLFRALDDLYWAVEEVLRAHGLRVPDFIYPEEDEE